MISLVLLIKFLFFYPRKLQLHVFPKYHKIHIYLSPSSFQQEFIFMLVLKLQVLSTADVDIPPLL